MFVFKMGSIFISEQQKKLQFHSIWTRILKFCERKDSHPPQLYYMWSMPSLCLQQDAREQRNWVEINKNGTPLNLVC
jgi:hypothetical protein